MWADKSVISPRSALGGPFKRPSPSGTGRSMSFYHTLRELNVILTPQVMGIKTSRPGDEGYGNILLRVYATGRRLIVKYGIRPFFLCMNILSASMSFTIKKHEFQIKKMSLAHIPLQCKPIRIGGLNQCEAPTRMGIWNFASGIPKPIFRCNAKPLTLDRRIGLDPNATISRWRYHHVGTVHFGYSGHLGPPFSGHYIRLATISHLDIIE